MFSMGYGAAEPGYVRSGPSSAASATIDTARVQLLPPPAPASDILSLAGEGEALRLAPGGQAEARIINRLRRPMPLLCRGLRGANASAAFIIAAEREYVLKPGPGTAGTCLITPAPFDPVASELGLAAMLVIEEEGPAAFDRDVPVLLKDLRLAPNGAVVAAAGARLGNALSLNGRLERLDLDIRRHERLRLRLANASTARILVIEARGVRPLIVALDGAPCEIFEPIEGKIVLAPGGRADVMIELAAPPEGPITLSTRIGPLDLDIVSFTYQAETPLRQFPLPSFGGLAQRQGPRLDLAKAKRVTLAPQQPPWIGDGEALQGSEPPVLFSARRGETVVLAVENDSQAPAVLHNDGYHMRPLDGLDDGVKPWVIDTVLLAPEERVLLAFVADRPGRHGLYWRGLAPPFPGANAWFEVTI